MRRTSGVLLAVMLVALAGCGSSGATSAPTTTAKVVAPGTSTTTSASTTTVAPPPTAAPTTTLPAVSAAEIRAAHRAEQAWRQSLADPERLGGESYQRMKSIQWDGAAQAQAQLLTRDLGRESVNNQHPLSIKIAADFGALFKSLGLKRPTLRILPVSPPPPPPLVITITGSGPSSAITLEINNREVQHKGPVPLPWTYVDRNHAATATFPVMVKAQDGSGKAGATITCTIFEGGENVATDTATGPDAAVTCTGPRPGA
jgi:hypothetical protein